MNAVHSSVAKTSTGVVSGDLLSRTATLPSGRPPTSTHELELHRELRRQAIGEAISSAALPCPIGPPSAASRISFSVSLLGRNTAALAGRRKLVGRVAHRPVRTIRWASAEPMSAGSADVVSAGLLSDE